MLVKCDPGNTQSEKGYHIAPWFNYCQARQRHLVNLVGIMVTCCFIWDMYHVGIRSIFNTWCFHLWFNNRMCTARVSTGQGSCQVNVLCQRNLKRNCCHFDEIFVSKFWGNVRNVSLIAVHSSVFQCFINTLSICGTILHQNSVVHDGVIKWKHFPRYWPFVRGINLSPANSPHKGQWRGALIFSYK